MVNVQRRSRTPDETSGRIVDKNWTELDSRRILVVDFVSKVSKSRARIIVQCLSKHPIREIPIIL